LIIGTILTPNGEPAEGVQFGFATTQRHAQIQNGRIHFDADVTVRTDASGRFRLSKIDSSINEQDYKLVFLHDAGFAKIRKAEFEARDEPITLTAWGRIEGIVYAGKEAARNAWVGIHYNPEESRDWDRPWVMYIFRSPCDTNGRFVFDRVFPGMGMVGQSIEINNGGGWHFSHLQSYEIKPGETLNVTIGGGGYAVQGEIVLPTEGYLERVDWRFSHVRAQPTYPERVVFSNVNIIPQLFAYIQNAPETTPGRLTPPNVREMLVRRWAESPAGREFAANDPELFERGIEAMNAQIEHDRRRHFAWERQVVSVVGEHGMFQLDDLTPGDWTLEVTLNWPRVPGQHWDHVDVWRTTMSISIPALSGGPPEEPMMIGPIMLGFDASDRRGPSLH
jgi:hypothetical protein